MNYNIKNIQAFTNEKGRFHPALVIHSVYRNTFSSPVKSARDVPVRPRSFRCRDVLAVPSHADGGGYRDLVGLSPRIPHHSEHAEWPIWFLPSPIHKDHQGGR